MKIQRFLIIRKTNDLTLQTAITFNSNLSSIQKFLTANYVVFNVSVLSINMQLSISICCSHFHTPILQRVCIRVIDNWVSMIYSNQSIFHWYQYFVKKYPNATSTLLLLVARCKKGWVQLYRNVVNIKKTIYSRKRGYRSFCFTRILRKSQVNFEINKR